MPILLQLLKTLRAHVAGISWLFLACVFVLHLLSSWILMDWAGEEKLVQRGVWFYYYVVTATTIGYGDFSPATSWGRWIAVLYVIPGGIGLFAALIGKSTALIVNFWRKGMLGQRDYSALESHTVLVGWDGEATERMVQLLMDDELSRTDKIVLCVSHEMENPLPDRVLFVRGDSLTKPSMLHRAGVKSAERIIISGGLSDEQTLATAFAVMACKPVGHVVAHFEQESNAQLLNAHYPAIECTRSLRVEVLVRAAQDPGISYVTSELLSVGTGPAKFSLRVPDRFKPAAFGSLLLPLKLKYDAILLGMRKAAGDLRLNPPADALVEPGDILFYMSDSRAKNVDWGTLQAPVMEEAS